jgi:uncharacterized protein (DUF2147 family)
MRDEMQAVPTPRLTALFAVLTFVFLGVSAARADTSPEGWWINSSGKAGILIAPCGAQLCGHIEWLRVPLDAAGKPKTDIHNPDASLRSRPDCGLTILGGFTEDSDGSWHGGWVYDPESGNTYKSNMHVGDDGKLHVRGYIGISLLGRTEIMTRPATLPQPCVPPG